MVGLMARISRWSMWRLTTVNRRLTGISSTPTSTRCLIRLDCMVWVRWMSLYLKLNNFRCSMRVKSSRWIVRVVTNTKSTNPTSRTCRINFEVRWWLIRVQSMQARWEQASGNFTYNSVSLRPWTPTNSINLLIFCSRSPIKWLRS